MKRVVVAVIAIAISGRAAAEPAEPAPRPVHDFHTLDRHTPVSSFQVSFGYGFWDQPDNPATPAVEAAIGVDLALHKLWGNGLGLYTILPVSHLAIESTESDTAIGNLELGALFAARVDPSVDVVLRVGAATRTAEGPEGASIAQPRAWPPRAGDLALRLASSAWFRMSASAMGQHGRIFWRGDVGVDVPFDEDDFGATYDRLLRFSAGGGYAFGKGEVTAELVTTHRKIDLAPSSYDPVGTTVAIGGRLTATRSQPGLAVLIPVGYPDGYGLDAALAFSLAVQWP